MTCTPLFSTPTPVLALANWVRDPFDKMDTGVSNNASDLDCKNLWVYTCAKWHTSVKSHSITVSYA